MKIGTTNEINTSDDTLYPTATERTETIKQVRNRAKCFAQATNIKLRANWADKLLKTIDGPDIGARVIVYKQLTSAGFDPITFKRDLTRASRRGEPSGDCLKAARALSNLDPHSLTEASPWRDPVLVDLVISVAPIWGKVTGRTAGKFSMKQSDTTEYEDQWFYFADWLHQMQEILGVEPSPNGRILDSLHAMKK